MTDTLQLATELIQKPSITPDDAGCMPLLIERLNRFHFQSGSIQNQPFLQN